MESENSKNELKKSDSDSDVMVECGDASSLYSETSSSSSSEDFCFYPLLDEREFAILCASTLADSFEGDSIQKLVSHLRLDWAIDPESEAYRLNYHGFEDFLCSDVAKPFIEAVKAEKDENFYGAVTTEENEHILMRVRDIFLSEEARAERRKRQRWMELKKPENQKTYIEGKQRIIEILKELEAYNVEVPYQNVRTVYERKYGVSLNEKEHKRLFFNKSALKNFLRCFRKEVIVISQNPLIISLVSEDVQVPEMISDEERLQVANLQKIDLKDLDFPAERRRVSKVGSSSTSEVFNKPQNKSALNRKMGERMDEKTDASKPTMFWGNEDSTGSSDESVKSGSSGSVGQGAKSRGFQCSSEPEKNLPNEASKFTRSSGGKYTDDDDSEDCEAEEVLRGRRIQENKRESVLDKKRQPLATRALFNSVKPSVVKDSKKATSKSPNNECLPTVEEARPKTGWRQHSIFSGNQPSYNGTLHSLSSQRPSQEEIVSKQRFRETNAKGLQQLKSDDASSRVQPGNEPFQNVRLFNDIHMSERCQSLSSQTFHEPYEEKLSCRRPMSNFYVPELLPSDYDESPTVAPCCLENKRIESDRESCSPNCSRRPFVSCSQHGQNLSNREVSSKDAYNESGYSNRSAPDDSHYRARNATVPSKRDYNNEIMAPTFLDVSNRNRNLGHTSYYPLSNANYGNVADQQFSRTGGLHTCNISQDGRKLGFENNARNLQVEKLRSKLATVIEVIVEQSPNHFILLSSIPEKVKLVYGEFFNPETNATFGISYKDLIQEYSSNALNLVVLPDGRIFQGRVFFGVRNQQLSQPT